MEAAVMGECIVVIDCPNFGYLEALQDAIPALLQLMQDSARQRVSCIFHLGPQKVTGSETYTACMKHLQHCRHFAAEHSFDPAEHAPTIVKSVYLQVRLLSSLPELQQLWFSSRSERHILHVVVHHRDCTNHSAALTTMDWMAFYLQQAELP
jgi:hypothetical protein